MLMKEHRKLFDFKARMATAIPEGVEAYKFSKDCKNKKIKYSVEAYLVGKNKVLSKVDICFLGLNLTFLDEESEDKDDEPAPELEIVADPLAATNPPTLIA